nr:hypothetical protein CFP56_71430 [Quercus suber]
MDSGFIERLQSTSLTEDEGAVINGRSDNQAKILEECSLSLIGRFLTSKPINNWAAKNLLRSVWKFGQDLKITDVGEELPLDKPIRRGAPVLSPEGDKRGKSKSRKTEGEKIHSTDGNREDPGGQSRETSKTTQHHGIELSNDNSASVETVTENDEMELITDSNRVNFAITTNQAPHIFKMQTDINDKQQKTEKLVDKLIPVAVTYMEMAEGANNGTMCDETLATIASRLTRTSPRDIQSTTICNTEVEKEG